MDLKKYIADVPDFPKPGILFRDITPLLQHPPAFRHALDLIKQGIEGNNIDAFAAIDARGFLIAAPLALEMDKPLLPVRKEGKLPREVVKVSYDLEYGSNSMELHRDAVAVGERVLVVDDLLATGGHGGGDGEIGGGAGWGGCGAGVPGRAQGLGRSRPYQGLSDNNRHRILGGREFSRPLPFWGCEMIQGRDCGGPERI